MDTYKRAGVYVARILKVEDRVSCRPNFELVINLTTAKSLGLDIPFHLPAARRRTDRVNRAECPLLAHSGHELVHCTCPLFGGKADMTFLRRECLRLTKADIDPSFQSPNLSR